MAQTLVDAARRDDGLHDALAQSLGVDGTMVVQLLEDKRGAALAVACKGSNIERAAFSALALLVRPGHDRAHDFAVLDAYDIVPMREATRVLRGWREGGSVAA